MKFSAARMAVTVAIAASVVAGGGASSWALDREETRVLIFAPGQYQNLPDAIYHSTTARQLRQRFLDSGYRDEQAQLLQARDDVASRRGAAADLRTALDQIAAMEDPGDSLVVFAATYGIRLQGSDYLVCGDAPGRIRIDPDSEQQAGLVSIAEILERMAMTRCRHQSLIIDAAAHDDLLTHEEEAAFGSRSLPVRGNQWLIVSNSNQLEDRTGSPEMRRTAFGRSLLDATCVNGDSNRDGVVSLFEVSDHVQSYAIVKQLAVPRLIGKATRDVGLLTAIETGDGLTPKQRDTLARQWIQMAQRDLVIEGKTERAVRSLDQARQLRPGQESLEQIDRLLDMALSAKGDVLLAWDRAHLAGRTLNLLAVRSIPLTIPESVRTELIEPGVIIEASRLTDDRAWLSVKRICRPVVRGGVLWLEMQDIEQRYLRVSDLDQAAPATGRQTAPESTPDEQFKRRLNQLFGSETSRVR